MVPYPTEEDIRAAMNDRAEVYCAAAKIKLSALGKIVKNDGSFFTKLKAEGSSFTIKTYGEVMRWFDEHPAPETTTSAG